MHALLQSLTQSGEYLSHGAALRWDTGLVWLHVVSDALTAAAYWAIPPALFIFVWKGRKIIPVDAPYGRRRVPYDRVILAFAVFIVACGTTHVMGVVTIWEPAFWFSGGIKAVTAIASVATAIALPPLVPKALALIRDARDSELRRVRLEEANARLERLNERLHEANRLRSELVANVSHELRTPLTLILGPTRELLDRNDLPAPAVSDLSVIQRNAQSLLGQVDDLLDAARLEVGAVAVDSRAVDVASIVDGIVEQVEPAARSRKIELRREGPASLPTVIDPEKVERILLNLLSNALKHAAGGDLVVVGLGREANGSRTEVVLEVRDSGPGVPPDERKEIFERFNRGRGRGSRGSGGTGLGLAIAREFAEAQGGSLVVGNAPEGGAGFTFRFPHVEPDEREPIQEWRPTDRVELEGARLATSPDLGAGRSAPEEAGSDFGVPSQATNGGTATEHAERVAVRDDEVPSLLLVEDDPELRLFLDGVLSRRYRIRTAEDGIEGLEALERDRPDVILSDIMMPRMDGEEFLNEVRKRPEMDDVPVLILTAKADSDLVSRLLQGGAQDYLLKPVGRDELMARIDGHVDVARTRRILQHELSSRESRLRVLAGTATRQRKELARALDEKSVLVQELHHRVKGNLQTITSLLNLQIRRVADDDARNALIQSRGRISAIALLHEKLYQTGDPVSTEMQVYLKSLVRDVQQASGPLDGRVVVGVDAEEIEVDAEVAVACGLMVHELVTNALRHGYPGDRRGRVEVRMRERPEGGGYRLVVEDDGVGLGTEPGPEPDGALGLDLVEALARQLDARVDIEGRDGVRCTIVIPPHRSPVAEEIRS